VTTGGLSLTGATVIRAGLGLPGRVAEADLTRAAEQLVVEAAGLSLEQVAARAREARDTLDVAGVPEREEERRERRFLTLTRLSDGMTRLAGLLDPESAAIIGGAIDAITSPRRGGPRFVDTTAAPVATADSDTRTIPQLMVDALVDIVQLATKADTSTTNSSKAKNGRLFGQRRIGVRVHIARHGGCRADGCQRPPDFCEAHHIDEWLRR